MMILATEDKMIMMMCECLKYQWPKSSGDLDGTPMMFRPITEGRKEASGRALERGDVHADKRDCNTYSAQVDVCFFTQWFNSMQRISLYNFNWNLIDLKFYFLASSPSLER